MTSDVPASTASYRGLLALVIVLGVLIVVGLVGLIVAAMLGAGRRGAEVTSAAPFVTAVPAPGARIESAELQGNRILMRLSGGEGDELVILDSSSGRLLGRVRLGSAP
jgi:hypothetical protein